MEAGEGADALPVAKTREAETMIAAWGIPSFAFTLSRLEGVNRYSSPTLSRRRLSALLNRKVDLSSPQIHACDTHFHRVANLETAVAFLSDEPVFGFDEQVIVVHDAGNLD